MPRGVDHPANRKQKVSISTWANFSIVERRTSGSTIAILPARGGSKRLPRKNIRPFLGVPMLVRTLETVTSSRLFDRVFVSTDDDEIAGLARSVGAEVPHMRPAHLSDDTATTAQVLDWELGQLKEVEPNISRICTIYPTAVFTRAEHLQESLELFDDGSFDLVFAGVKFPSPIWRAYSRSEDSTAVMVWEDHYKTRTQDLPVTYFDAGQFYWSNATCWTQILNDGSPNTSRVGIYPMGASDAVDIDDEEDWMTAERLFAIRDER